MPLELKLTPRSDSREQRRQVWAVELAVLTRDVNGAFKAMTDPDTGITFVNAPTIGAEAHLPFGGVRQTGNGHREGGWEVYDFY